MPEFLDRALVLRRWDFRETSQVLALFTRSRGKVRALAKGIKRKNPKFSGPADLLAEAEVLILTRPRGAMALLLECDLLEFFPGIRASRRRLLSGLHLARTLDRLLADEEPHPDAFDAARETLSALDAGAPPVESLVRFETTLLKTLGFAPSLDRCARCGAPPPAGVAPYDPAAGGVLCAPCAEAGRGFARLSPSVRQTLLSLATFARPERVRIPAAEADACHAVLDAAIRHHAGARPPL